ncbi:hypothetical protein [Celeribacter sp.]|uniref:hypothetical protein n=1 Tax=Celeribacter sp. TaxID=1890673 RepID=UPI003A95CB7B
MKTDPTVRYATLNSVADAAGFRRALLKGKLGSGVFENGARLGDTFGKLANVGNIGTLARDIVEERLMEALPETLIFDDLERTAMEPELVFGLINDFVEHEDKRVILLVNSEKHPWKDAFLEKKEKLIGRTLRVEANLAEALPSFIELIGDGKGQTYLDAQHDLIREVFEQAKHNNLRLLRNALRECAQVLDQIEDALFEAQEPMARFTRTYLALAMALGKGEITEEDVRNRDRINWAKATAKVEGQDEPEDTALEILDKRHVGADIFDLGGSVLTLELGVAILVRGHIASENLNGILRQTGQFTKQDENPLWKRLFEWRHISWQALPTLIEEARVYLFETDPIEPGPYLHIVQTILHIEERGGLTESRQDFLQRLHARVGALKASGGLPLAAYGKMFGWERHGRSFYFGGYGFDPKADMFELIKAMEQAQVALFDESQAAFAEQLMTELKEDLKAFDAHFWSRDGALSYERIPVLERLPAEEVARVLVGHIENGRARSIGDIFEYLVSRHRSVAEWDAERVWADQVKEKMQRLVPAS